MHDFAPELEHLVFEAQGEQNHLTVLQRAVGFQEQPSFTDVAGPTHAAAQMTPVFSKDDIIHQIQGPGSLKFPFLEILHFLHRPLEPPLI